VTILAVAGALVDIGYGLPKPKTMSLTAACFQHYRVRNRGLSGVAVSARHVFPALREALLQ
jgi:hypothetical protein